MRIVIIGPLPPLRGGIAAHTLGALDAFRAQGHEVRAIGYSRLYPRWVAGARPGIGRRSTGGVDDVTIDCFDPRTWRRAAVEVRRHAPDMVLAQYWTPVAAAPLRAVLAGARTGTRIVVSHNIDPHEPIPCARALARWLMKRCDGAIFHSLYVRDRAIALGCDLPVAVASMPLLATGSQDARRPPPEVVAAWSSGVRLFVSPGHLRRYKGLCRLAAAWERVAPVEGAVLVVAGEWLATRADARALRALGSRALLIPRYLSDEELLWLLTNSEAVLLPYLAASQSGLLPMALRLAPHVVVSDVGGLCERWLADDRPPSSVTVIAPDDVTTLAGALKARLSEPARRAPAGGDGALRQRAASISVLERRDSWLPFVSAALGLVADEGSSRRASNRVGTHSSESCVGDGGREQPAVAWYHARGPAR